MKAVIFDIDGTLVDSNDLHARAWQEAFAHFGKDLPYALIRSQIGKGSDLLVPDLLSAREMRQLSTRLRDFRKKHFRENYLEKVKPFPGVAAQFAQLRERGLALALASSADEEEVEYFVSILGVADLIKATTSAKDARMSKPSPEIFLAALEQVKAADDETLVVGDTPYDILAAHRCCLSIAAVRSGGFADEYLQKAEFLMQDVGELVQRIEEVDGYFRNG